MPPAKFLDRFRQAVRHAFAIPRQQKLTERERAFLDRLARKVVERDIASAAVFFLESVKPLNYLGSQVVVFFKPIISLAFRPEQCDQVAELLSKRGALEALAEMIETYDTAKAANSKIPDRRNRLE